MHTSGLWREKRQYRTRWREERQQWRGSDVLSGASSLLHLGRAAPGQREHTETVAKLPQPAQPRHHAWGARPEDHVITNYLYSA